MEENILRFEVSVYDIIFVHVLDCCANLSNVLSYNLFRHFSVLFQFLIEVIAKTGLKNQVS